MIMSKNRTLALRGLAVLLVAATSISLAGCAKSAETGVSASARETGYAKVEDMDFGFTERQKDATFDAASASRIVLGAGEGSLAAVEGEGVVVDADAVRITQAGTYVIEGQMDDGQLVVEAPDEAQIHLVLSGVRVFNADGPALSVLSGADVLVTLADGTDNALADGADYLLADDENEPNAVLYSKVDLAVNGSGSLSVSGSYEHGINSEGVLAIAGGRYEVTAPEDALRGKNGVKISEGSFDLRPAGDAIKSNNDEDAAYGFVSIDGGSFVINAGDDAVNAYSYCRIAGGSFDVTAAGDAFKTDADLCISGGDISINAGDDALHAEYTLFVDGGTIDVQSCVEGFEAERVYINGGTSHIVSSDDAINAAAPETDAVPKEGFETSLGVTTENVETCLIQVNEGYTVVDAGGDGIDSNGYVEVNGGILLVEGPSSSADGVFDYGIEATVTGGTVLMVGAAGMAQGFTGGTQPFAMVQVSGSADQSVALAAQGGELLASYTPKRDYQLVIVSSPAMTDGVQYDIYLGAEIPNANDDGFADGEFVSADIIVQFTASTTPSAGPGGMGGPGGPGAPMGLGGEGDSGAPMRPDVADVPMAPDGKKPFIPGAVKPEG